MIGLYGVPASACSLAAASGFNVIQSYEFESDRAPDAAPWIQAASAYLDAAERHGLRVLLGVPRSWLRQGHDAAVRQAIRELRAHPALLAWYEDEIAQGGDLKAVERLQAAVAAEDPAHGVILEEGKDLPELRAWGRVRMFTYYPVTFDARERGRLSTLPQRFPVQRLQTPFWPVLQAYGRDLVRDYPKRNLVAPQWTELEFTLGSAIIAGARGAFVYTYTIATRYDAARESRKQWPYVDVLPLPEVSPSLWASAQRCAAQARTMFILLAGAAPVTRAGLEVPPGVESGSWKAADGATVIVLANPRYSPCTAHVTLAPHETLERLDGTVWTPVAAAGSRAPVALRGPGSAMVRLTAQP